MREEVESAELMEEPKPARCARCGEELTARLDPVTGKPVTAHGRALMECRGCGVVEITEEYAAARRRYRIVRALLVVGSWAGTLFYVIQQIIGIQGSQPAMGMKATIGLTLGAGTAALVWLLTGSLATAIARGTSPAVRVNAWALTVFWMAVLVLTVWMDAHVAVLLSKR
jgi:hypothetical protein